MANYKYKIRCGAAVTPGVHEKELTVEEDEESIIIRTSGACGSIVRFWSDGEVTLYEDAATSQGFKPRLR